MKHRDPGESAEEARDLLYGTVDEKVVTRLYHIAKHHKVLRDYVRRGLAETRFSTWIQETPEGDLCLEQNGFLWVAPGSFSMGSPRDELGRRDNEPLPHAVVLTQGFWMEKHPLTCAQWRQLAGRDYRLPKGIGSSESAVGGIGWYAAVAACNARSVLEGFEPAYSLIGASLVECSHGHTRLHAQRVERVEGASGYRLPTEAEWEYACRAGTQTATYAGDLVSDPWRMDLHTVDPVLGEIGWYLGDPTGVPAVCQKRPNPWGLFDMLGNVSEWCWDWFGDLDASSAPRTDPRGPEEGAFHALRGGSVYSFAGNLRASSREPGPVAASAGEGFRCVRDVL